MLLELKVENFAIIDSIQITFKDGLNILSGETGAGKSVLLKSLALLMGGKAFSDTVRSGATSSVIEGYFDLHQRKDILDALTEIGVETPEESLVVKRVVSSQGKSRVYLNGSLSALSSLRDIVAPLIELTGQSAPLIEMTGQHDNRHLQSKAYHLDILDHYTGSWALRHKVAKFYAKINELTQEIDQLERSTQEREQKLDFLIFQRDEIKSIHLAPGDEVRIEGDVRRLKNASRLNEFIETSEYKLYSSDHSALTLIHNVIQHANELSRLDNTLVEKMAPLEQAKTLIEECIYDLRTYNKDLNSDPGSLNDYEEKLSQLRKLQKKYGLSVEEILKTLAHIENEISGLENSDENLLELKKQLAQEKKEATLIAKELHQRRASGADLLIKGVNDELADLNMKGVTFGLKIDELSNLSPTGFTDIEFMIQASKKDGMRPITKVASGGELSRILLSLKRIVGLSDQPRTYLFDEVDAGVSGETAEKVGRKLKSIAQGQQVICITHLPQVASFADSHFLIQKSPTKKGVHMEVRPLNNKEKINEIARLISGEKITTSSINHAKQLLQQAH